VPELPEVETVVRDLRPLLTGRRLASVRRGDKELRRPWRPEWEPLLRGRVVEVVRRRGKWIVLDLSGDLHLVVHLGMTGQLTVADAAEPAKDHTHLVFDLASRGRQPPAGEARQQLRFRDVRRFGSVTLFEGTAQLAEFFDAAGLGTEPFTLDPAWWRQRLAATRRCLKAVLLDQSVVAGVGNIYADEALFEAKLHPARAGASLGPSEADRLRKAVVTVLERAITKRGSSIRNYVGGSGQRGGYQEEFRVYGRAGGACVRCKGRIERVRLAGRSTHFCPRCQAK
jgi:formamidopyrimidine-DNA glycosylase